MLEKIDKLPVEVFSKEENTAKLANDVSFVNECFKKNEWMNRLMNSFMYEKLYDK